MQAGNKSLLAKFCVVKYYLSLLRRGSVFVRKIDLPQSVKYIINVLEQNGFEGYAVGGCVRDALLGREPKDFDITTNALPQQVKKLFRRTIDTGIKHGTVTIMINREGYEVTTYRIDGEYEDGRHPNTVKFTPNLIDDLMRRDFTINAMAYNDRDGVVDAFNGQQDLENGIIRCVGCAHDRFTEDALRIMRAVRFAAQLGFDIEEGTREAIKELAGNLNVISAERIAAELFKLIMSDNPGMIREAYNMGITGMMLPEFDVIMNTPQNSPYHSYSVGEHTIRVLEATEKIPYLRWAALLHDIGKPATHTTDEKGIDHFHGHETVSSEMAHDILRRLRLDNNTIGAVTKLIKYHDYPLTASEKIIRRSMNRIGTDIYPLFLKLRWADLAGKSSYSREINTELFKQIDKTYDLVCEAESCVAIRDLAVNGKDIIELGAPKGAIIGEILEKLLDMVIDEPTLNNREYLLSEAAKLI